MFIEPSQNGTDTEMQFNIMLKIQSWWYRWNSIEIVRICRFIGL